jgi:hypothetical protein
MIYLLKTSGDVQMLFAAVTHLLDRLSLQTVLTVLTVKVEKSAMCFVSTRRPEVSVIGDNS